jgi:hypothetical protein
MISNDPVTVHFSPMMNACNSSYRDSHESPLVTPHMVQSRTVQLALIAGRSSLEIRQRDYEQAKRELTGETDFIRQQAMLYPGLQRG